MRIAVLAPLTADVASRFPDDPSGRRGVPHVTVLYVDADHPDSVSAELVHEVIQRVAAAGAPISVELVDDVEYFGDDGETRAAALRVDQTWDLRLLRLALRFELRTAGVETPQIFPTYEPHATLAYVSTDEVYNGPRPAGPARLVALQLRVDDGPASLLPLGHVITPDSEQLSSSVDNLRLAIRQRRKVLFQYTRGTGERTIRTVRPIEIERDDNGWVLGAFCELRQAYRTFRLERMASVEVLDVTFEQLQAVPPPDPETTVVALRALRFGSDLEDEAARRLQGADVPEGWVIGQPFRTLATGEIYCRWTGKRRGKPVTESDLIDAVRVFESGEDVGVDKDHKTENPDGAVLAMWVVDDGDRHSLAVVPAYGPRMARYVADSNGSLWSSPELIWTTVHDPRTGEPVGAMRVHSLAITADPAQAHRVLDRVRLVDERGTAPRRPPEGEETPSTPPGEEHDVEELKEMLAAFQAEMNAKLAGFDDRLGKLEGGEQMAADAPDEEPAEAAEQPEGEAYANQQLATLQAQVAKLTAEKIERERDHLVTELLSTERITRAEKGAAEKVYAKGGADLVREVYGNRAPGSAVPKVKGHGAATEASTVDEWAALDKAAKERMSAEKVDYHDAVRLVLADRRPAG